MSFIEGQNRAQVSLLPPSIDDYIATDSLVRVVDAFVDTLHLNELGFDRTIAASTGRPGFRPAHMLRLALCSSSGAAVSFLSRNSTANVVTVAEPTEQDVSGRVGLT